MAERLLIHFRPCHVDQICWAMADDAGKIKGELHFGTLADISEAARGHRATVLIDSSCTSLESVKIPSNNRQRQMQAVPFALEDSLASDIDELYFALGKKQADDKIPVVTIDKQLFQSTIDQFRQAHIFIDNMSADCLALPLEKDSWTVLIDNDGALIKTAASSGHFCDRELLPTLLPVLFEQAEQAPQSILLLHENDDSQATELLPSLDAAVSIKTYAQHPLRVFASHLGDAKTLNMLQGKYAPRRESNALLVPWKSVAAVALVWLTLQLIYAGFEIKQLQYKNQQLTSEIEKEFKQANPGTRKFNNMQKRMERRLKELRGGGGGSDDEIFIELLAGAAKSFENKQITIHGMIYNNKHIDMELQAASLQTLEAVKNQLSSIKNIKTTLSTSVEQDKVKGRLRLEKQS